VETLEFLVWTEAGWQELEEEARASIVGFVTSQADDSLYISRVAGSILLLLLVYVDDMLCAGKERQRIDEFKHQFDAHFKITNLGEVSHILGIQVTCGRAAQTITLDQTAYINKVLAHLSMQNCSSVHTPLTVKEQLTAV
jgi:hypothetical protein